MSYAVYFFYRTTRYITSWLTLGNSWSLPLHFDPIISRAFREANGSNHVPGEKQNDPFMLSPMSLTAIKIQSEAGQK
jgi:hypothetical protein